MSEQMSEDVSRAAGHLEKVKYATKNLENELRNIDRGRNVQRHKRNAMSFAREIIQNAEKTLTEVGGIQEESTAISRIDDFLG